MLRGGRHARRLREPGAGEAAAAAARPRRLRDQPRREPGRGRLLFGHGGRRARRDVLRRPSIAVSLAVRAEAGLHARRRLRRAAGRAGPRARGCPSARCSTSTCRRARRWAWPITVQGRREHEGTIFEGLDPRRRTYYWIEEGTRPLGQRRDVGHPRRAQGPHLGQPAADRHHASRRPGAFRGWLPALGAAERASEEEARRSRPRSPWTPRPSRGSGRSWRSSVARDKVAVLPSSGRGSAWLERVVRDHEVGGSNPLAPTRILPNQFIEGLARGPLPPAIFGGDGIARMPIVVRTRRCGARVCGPREIQFAMSIPR